MLMAFACSACFGSTEPGPTTGPSQASTPSVDPSSSSDTSRSSSEVAFSETNAAMAAAAAEPAASPAARALSATTPAAGVVYGTPAAEPPEPKVGGLGLDNSADVLNDDDPFSMGPKPQSNLRVTAKDTLPECKGRPDCG
jgi:hypothetical protein